MTIAELLHNVTLKFEQKKITSAQLDAEVILSYVLKKPKEYLFLHPDQSVKKMQLLKIKSLIFRRCRYEPVAYLVGAKEFYGLNFIVNKDVLIPRPETESLVEEVINNFYNLKPVTSNLAIADVGTGSGCIAITLAKEFEKVLTFTRGGSDGIFTKYNPSSPSLIKGRNVTVYATDISAKALAVAKKNAKKYNAKIKFINGNLLTPLKNTKIDIIVANLPYLKKSYKNILNTPEMFSLNYEPQQALYGGDFGIEIYKKLFTQIKKYLNPQAIICEINPDTLKHLNASIKKNFPDKIIKIKKDLTGLKRILVVSDKT